MTIFPLAHHLAEFTKNKVSSRFSTEIPATDGGEVHPNPIYLNYGCPNDGFFPIEKITVHTLDKPFQTKKLSKAEIDNLDLKTIEIVKKELNEDLIYISDGFQYMAPSGHDNLYKFNKSLVTLLNKPNYDDWDLVITLGAADGLNKIFKALINPGDTVLVEEFTFTPSTFNLSQFGGIAVPVPVDFNEKSEGINVSKLENLLDNWSAIHPDLRKPKALYTIPTGQNPIGTTSSLETRKKIYKILEKHDVLIIEDDPYGYIVLNDDFINRNVTRDEYINKYLSKSYLTIDTSGRVLRAETYSKTFAPGSRLGFVVGHKGFIDTITTISSLSTRSPSGISQTILYNVIKQRGGLDSWLDWKIEISKAYSIRKKIFYDYLKASKINEKHFIEVIEPKNGMFLSVKINFELNEKLRKNDIFRNLALLNNKCLKHGVIVILGRVLAVGEEAIRKSNFVRLTLTMADDEDELLEGIKRFASSIEDLFEYGN
ncbi:aromatic amino acid aminotransferase II [Ascoidea rubescens DSM 1968]|uniref:Aromatic amino acid aminotransferase II n=1 Tax=Ascoidea rubescens DSM 1968 TaxID=1344418 RepID=A0A1D2VGL3_9ASCO|nr:aromatic amino acid aminotransferase II [Ascoidea rubescens DSM 1968]ODV60739.1 aromatic amino acid aminotransferase II [Ascoidea rubescens DSM 1968]